MRRINVKAAIVSNDDGKSGNRPAGGVETAAGAGLPSDVAHDLKGGGGGQLGVGSSGVVGAIAIVPVDEGPDDGCDESACGRPAPPPHP
ncbi:hypothetical protein NL676_000957 [Syzygium grande]|nr:hypothetical protein NL676_000957 [Syzygium grande]